MSEQLNEVISRDSLLSELDKSLEDGSLVEISVGDSRKRFKPYERVEDEGTVNFYGRAYNISCI